MCEFKIAFVDVVFVSINFVGMYPWIRRLWCPGVNMSCVTYV